jgi:hypothetical protein
MNSEAAEVLRRAGFVVTCVGEGYIEVATTPETLVADAARLLDIAWGAVNTCGLPTVHASYNPDGHEADLVIYDFNDETLKAGTP